MESIRIEPLETVVDLVGEPTREETFLGVEATRWETTCAQHYDKVRICTAAVWLHGGDDVKFTAEAATKERAEELLSTITRVTGVEAIPGPNAFHAREGSGDDQGPSASGQAYLDALAAVGATVKVENQDMPGVTPGTVLGVWPQPGTFIKPGDLVTVTTVAPQDTAAERASAWASAGERVATTPR